MLRSVLYYPLVIGAFVLLIWYVIGKGAHLKMSGNTVSPTPSVVAAPSEPAVQSGDTLWLQFLNNFKSPLSLLLLRIIIILVVSRVFGLLFTLIRQPTVVGEMVAGIFLGPSIVGLFFPEFSEFIFPK